MNRSTPPDPADSPEGGFLSRWSRRKSQARQPGDAPADAAASATAASTTAAATTASATTVSENAANATNAAPPRTAEPAAPPPTLDEVAQLDANSDYRRFAARDVDPSVRNAAMKKLFHSDPHFNVMDGLDVYIDDYNSAAPLPKAMLRNLLQARVLGLIDDELKEQERPEDLLAPPQAAAVEVDALGTEGAQSLAPVERPEPVSALPAWPDTAAETAAETPRAGAGEGCEGAGSIQPGVDSSAS